VLALGRYGRDTIVSGDLDGHVIVWDHNTGKVIKEFDWYREPVFEVAFSSDGKKVLSTSWDGGLYVYDLETNERTGMILQENSVFSACFSPDNLYVVVSKLGKTLEMIEPESKTIVRSFAGHTENVSKVRYLKNGKSIISASWDGTIRIWDPATGFMTRKFKPGKGAIFDFAVQGNDQVVIAAGADRVIRFVSLKDGSILKELSGHNTEITTIRMNQAETMLISQSIDGVIKFWDIDKGKELFEHIHLGSDDWMVRVPSGYFNATAGARDKINFVRGVETFSPDQFFEKFYRPEILKKALGTNSSLHNELEKSPLNVAKIAVTPVESEKRAVVRLKIYDNDGGVDEVKLMHNGKRLEVNLAETSRSGNPPVVEYIDTLNLVAGKNIFTVSSFNKSRFESKPAESEVFSNIVEKSATCHMFVVGINKYRNKSMSLSYAKDDAESFAKLIGESSQGLFGQIKIHELYDENATRQNILDTLEKLSHKIHLHDVFIFFYAGHGSISENNFFLVPTECVRAYDESVLAREGVSAGDLQENLKKIKALKQIIILDACHSGGSVEMLAMRGSQEERAISQLARSAGIHILASAGSEQTAKEIPELKHGIFTHVLLKALSGAADGAPSDGKITVYELKSYLDDQVPVINEQYSGKAQYPHTFSRGQDFPVVTGK
jgi:WD40 repeat protein